MFLHLRYYRQKYFSIWKEKRLNHCQSANIHKCECKIIGTKTSLRWKINVKSFDYWIYLFYEDQISHQHHWLFIISVKYLLFFETGSWKAVKQKQLGIGPLSLSGESLSRSLWSHSLIQETNDNSAQLHGTWCWGCHIN